jgi:hypothetical protein
MRFPAFFLLSLVFVACTSSSSTPRAPWSAAPITDVPDVYRTEWRNAENRSSCALIAFANPPAGATPRRANFSGGWAVAYDTPSQRSAFGIAGTGADASASSYQWPDRQEWSDGSSATWGLEGGTGPNHLAYVRIAGQGCLYNVWSAGGEEQLRSLLGQLRFVSL